MTLSIIYFTENGEILAKKISDICVSLDCDGRNYTATFYDGRDKENPQSKFEWLEQQMKNKNPIIFIGACGIAVRLIAPFIQSKLTDSPVLVMDEMGQYVIPLLSGHVGGANELAKALAEKLDAAAVITTATDLEKKFAVDVFAKKSGLSIVNKDGIAKISSKILRGEQISVYIDKEIIDKYSDNDEIDAFQIGHYRWKIPKELFWINASKQNGDIKKENISDVVDNCEAAWNKNDKPDIYIGRTINKEYDLCLGIKEYVVGIGCRRGKSQEEITEFVARHCRNMNIDMSQIAAVVSIDVKKNEEGLVGFCDSNRIPFITYSKDVLAEVPGQYSSSAFVESQVGVDNVCERSVVTYISHWSKQPIKNDTSVNLILKKQAENGMTIAIGRL